MSEGVIESVVVSLPFSEDAEFAVIWTGTVPYPCLNGGLVIIFLFFGFFFVPFILFSHFEISERKLDTYNE